MNGFVFGWKVSTFLQAYLLLDVVDDSEVISKFCSVSIIALGNYIPQPQVLLHAEVKMRHLVSWDWNRNSLWCSVQCNPT